MLFAQHTDGGVWMSVGVSHEPVADFTIDVNEEIRYNVSVAELYQINTNIGVDYKLSKNSKPVLTIVIQCETDVILIVLDGVLVIKKACRISI